MDKFLKKQKLQRLIANYSNFQKIAALLLLKLLKLKTAFRLLGQSYFHVHEHINNIKINIAIITT